MIGWRGLHRDARILAVRIGDQQLVALAGRRAVHRDVGDARGERAAHAGDLLVDLVGDAMRAIAQLRLRHRRRYSLQQHLPVEHIHQLELAAAPCRRCRARPRADHHVVGAQRAPARRHRPRRRAWAAPAWRRAPRRGSGRCSPGRAGPPPRRRGPPSAGTARANGTTATGTGSVTPRVMSIFSSAWAAVHASSRQDHSASIRSVDISFICMRFSILGPECNDQIALEQGGIGGLRQR